MAEELNRVEPGDLITAEMFNALVDCVEDLRSDVDSLADQTSALRITSIVPTSAVVGDPVTVHGFNFVTPVALNQLTVGGAAITSFLFGSGPDQLIFATPALANLPRTVDVVVTNANGQDSIQLEVAAAAPVPDGELVFVEDFDHLLGVDVDPGVVLDLTWQVEAVTTIPETFDVSVQFTNPSGTAVAQWQANADVRDGNGTAVTSIVLSPQVPGDPATGPVPIRARLVVPGSMGPGDRIDVALDLASRNAPADPDLNRPSAPVRLTGGQPLPLNDPRVSFDAPIVSGTLNLDGGTVEVPVNVSGIVQVTANFDNDPVLGSVAGTYDYSAEVIPPAPGIWSIDNVAPPDSPESDGTGQNIDVSIELQAPDPSATRLLRITATRQGANPISSFTNIPIREQN